MNRLVEKIVAEFTPETLIEINVLDKNGDPYEVFSGLPQRLTESHLEQILREPGCFYVLSIIGIDKSLADAVDIQLDSIIRKEFCWLTGLFFSILLNNSFFMYGIL